MHINLFDLIKTADVDIVKYTIFVKDKPIGIFLPSVVFAVEDTKTILISGPKGNAKANLNQSEDIWAALVASGSILFGNNDEPLAVQKLLDNAECSRTISYLCSMAKNCSHVIQIYAKIRSSCVAIFGLGGIGSLTATVLAGAGVGRFILADSDLVEQSNLNRQLFYRRSDIGLAKADVLKRELQDRYSYVDVECFKDMIDKNNAMHLLDKCDCVLISADSPLGMASTILSQTFKKIDALHCGYVHATSSLFYMPKNATEMMSKDPLQWERIPTAIMPSYGPTNMELASFASTIILLSICGFIDDSKNIKLSWDTKTFPRDFLSL